MKCGAQSEVNGRPEFLVWRKCTKALRAEITAACGKATAISSKDYNTLVANYNTLILDDVLEDDVYLY